jgi:spermidine synthase
MNNEWKVSDGKAITLRNRPGDFHVFEIRRVFASLKTQFQSIQIAELETLGRCLLVDGTLQSAALDEFIYHEALVHPAMLLHPNPQRILVLGGGEGATLREVLNYSGVEEVVMVDIDQELVAACKQHLQWDRDGFSDPRTRLVYGDARGYLASASQRGDKYDVIVVDVSDPLPDGLAAMLFTREFYELAASCLEKPGVLVTQALGIRYEANDRSHAAVYRTISSVFASAWPYMEYLPSYDCLWGFVLGCNVTELAFPIPAEIRRRLHERLSRSLRFYDEQSHTRMFSLPKNLRDFLDSWQTVAEDHTPVEFAG